MAQYIDKSALVAEIERRIKVNKELMLGLRNIDCYQGKNDTLNGVLAFLDTLEVKEVDLEKEIQDIFQKYKNGYNGLIICNKTDFSLIAKHFFELGMQVNKAQKGE